MNKRYHARWNIISYIKIHFNRLRQLFSPFLLPHIFSLLWGSLSSLFRAFVFLLLRKLWISFVFVLNLLHFFPTSLYPSFYLCLPHPHLHLFMNHGCTRWCAHFTEKVFFIVTIFLAYYISSQSSKALYLLMCSYYWTYFYFYNHFACLKGCHWVALQKIALFPWTCTSILFFSSPSLSYTSLSDYLKSLQRRLNGG